MTQEEKDLLLKDLCSRLPYGVKMNHIADNEHSPKILIGVVKDMITLKGLGGYECVDIEDYKPCLFPISSMTEEQKKELKDIIDQTIVLLTTRTRNKDYGIDQGKHHFDHTLELDWLNKNHFDFRGLIEKGLALDATGLNVY